MKRGAAIALLAAVLLAATFFAGFRAGRRDTAADVVVRVDTVVLERPAPDAVRYERTVVRRLARAGNGDGSGIGSRNDNGDGYENRDGYEYREGTMPALMGERTGDSTLPALLGKGTEAGERINSVTVFPGKEAGEGTLPALTGERTGTGDGTAPALTGERTGTGDNTLPALPGERTGSGDGTGQSRLTAGLANAPGDKAEQDGKGRGRKRRDKAAQVAADRDKNPSDEMHRERTGGYATVGKVGASGTAPGGTLERNGAGRNGIGYNQQGAEKPFSGRASASDNGRKGNGGYATIREVDASGTAPGGTLKRNGAGRNGKGYNQQGAEKPFSGRASASDKGRKGSGGYATIGEEDTSGTAPKIALEVAGKELPQGAATPPGDGDSVLVEVPIARYHFSDSTYRAEITGYDVRMERMEVYPRTVVRTVRSREPSRWGVSVGVGIAVTPSGRVEPALQLQVGWRLFALGRRRER